MIKELIQFTTELFPSISPYTKENVNKAIEQFDYERLEWFRSTPIDYLSQGDIIKKIPFTFVDENKKKIARANKYYEKMCFTNSQLDGYFIDFTRATAFNRNLLLKLLENKTNVEYSLNQYGYYLLLTKLTIYFMRPEDKETNEFRAEEKVMNIP